jgi:predicted dehydrogenase
MLSKKSITRRDFLQKGTGVAAGVMATGVQAFGAGKVVGANERINVAVVGIHNRGGRHLQNFPKLEGVNVTALCDCDENLFGGRLDELKKLQGDKKVKCVQDIRRLLDDKDIDAISVATPDHWHALAAIWACQAGKDVYLEKPMAHNLWEGRKAIEAAAKYNKVVQIGLQNRSIGNIQEAMEFIHSGGLGEIYMARVLCLNPRDPIGEYPDGPNPDDGKKHKAYGYPVQGKIRPFTADYLRKVDYSLWLGPAKKRAFNRNRFHYNWHWHWDYGSGDIGNTSPHALDLAVWAMERKSHPSKICSKGGYFAFKSAQQTPNVQTTTFQYGDGKILESEVRGVYTNDEVGVRVGNLFFGSKGWMSIVGSTWKTFFGRKNEAGPSSTKKDVETKLMDRSGSGDEAHYRNFINVVRSRKMENLNCNAEKGFKSTVLPLVANISYKLGRELKFDSDKEQFINDREANAMLREECSKGFVVPEQV